MLPNTFFSGRLMFWEKRVLFPSRFFTWNKKPMLNHSRKEKECSSTLKTNQISIRYELYVYEYTHIQYVWAYTYYMYQKKRVVVHKSSYLATVFKMLLDSLLFSTVSWGMFDTRNRQSLTDHYRNTWWTVWVTLIWLVGQHGPGKRRRQREESLAHQGDLHSSSAVLAFLSKDKLILSLPPFSVLKAWACSSCSLLAWQKQQLLEWDFC